MSRPEISQARWCFSHRFALAFFCFLPPLLLGCSGGQATVTGTVTYDGKEVANGTISFYPVDGEGPTAGGMIKNGKYTVTNLTPGKKRVEIDAQPEARPG